ncbi:MAG: hypothetical protein ABIJ56_15625 [Pseudomonadota bacterium]
MGGKLKIPVFMVLPFFLASCWMLAGLEKSDLPGPDAADVSEDDGMHMDADAPDADDDADGAEQPGDGPEEMEQEDAAGDADDPEAEAEDGFDAPSEPPDDPDALEEFDDSFDVEPDDMPEDAAIEDMPADEPDGPPRLTCPGATTLEELVGCITVQMPREGSEGFVAPDNRAQSNWASVARRMLQGHCDEIDVPIELENIIRVFTFNDSSTSRDFCVLMETLDEDADGTVDRGWGTFIVDPDPSRELNIHITHPVFCTTTELEGVSIFKGVGGRSYLMGGAHREANSRISSCQAAYFEADAAHNVNNMDQPAVREIMSFYADLGRAFVSIQYHGMASASCLGVDVYMTYGRSTNPSPDAILIDLRDNLRTNNPDWVVNVPGDTPPCTMSGSTNVQGRLLNDVPGNIVCTAPAIVTTGRFIYIEQKTEMRLPDDWIDAIVETWP